MSTRRDFLVTAALGAGATLFPGRARATAPIATAPAAPPADPWAQVPAILARIRPPVIPRRDFVVTAYGARGDGRTDARPAIMAAIGAANAAGGGRVVLPAGTWWSEGPVHLKSNVELHVSEGATLRFTPDPERYLPLVLTRWEGTELYNYSPLIYAYQANNVAITGRGTIDGNSKTTFATWKPQQEPAQMRLREMGGNGTPVHGRVFGPGHWLRPTMIQFMGCRNVLVEGLTIVDSPFWTVHPTYCQNVIARDLRINSRNLNNDGVDPDSSVDVLIERCVFNTGDDGVAVKSGRDADAWRVGQPTENVIVRNCEMNSDANGLVIGSEMSGGVRNVFMENCRIGNATNSGIYFKSNLDRGGSVENIHIRNVQVGDAGTFIHFTTEYHGYRGGNFPTRFQNVSLDGITCRSAKRGIYAVGVPQAVLRDITLRDITVARALQSHDIRNVHNFQLQRVLINGAAVELPGGRS
ncbi:MAG TPA: glycoside hydrolase family 28 protein [Longimicrobium sp.]|jgi:polygalacturonase